MHLDTNGKISICKGYSRSLGEIGVNKFSDILFNAESYYLKNNTANICINCGVFEICYSCQAVIEKYENNYKKESICEVLNA